MSLRRVAFIVFIGAITLFQVALGVWQWGRMGEKRAFIAAIEKAAAGEPITFEKGGVPRWSRVTLTGRYLHDRTSYVRTSRPEAKPGEAQAGSFGVVVMTPFVTRRCDIKGERCALMNIYVNRGFVPTPPDGKIPHFDKPDDPVTIIGFLRPGEKTGLFQPGGDPARGVWFQRDTEAMALANRLPGADNAGAASYLYAEFIDRQAQPGEKLAPFGIEPAAFLKAIPNNHFQYAMTWWALAATNLLVLAFFLGAQKKKDQSAR